MKCYNEDIYINPNETDAYNEIGNILYNYKRHEEAVNYCNDAIKIDPNCAAYHTNKGHTLKDLGGEMKLWNSIMKQLEYIRMKLMLIMK